MASKKKNVVKEEINENIMAPVETTEVPEVPEVTSETNIIPEEPKVEEPKKSGPKYEIGSIVFVSKEAGADLNGFKLFPQYKKYTYTVEAYDAKLGVYSLRRLNLSLKLKEADIVAPSERDSNAVMRKQY